jgi:hypothetical protein
MALVGIMKCAGILLDIYDSERVPVGISKNKYYMTPRRTDLANKWLWENGLDKITTVEQIQKLADDKILGAY